MIMKESKEYLSNIKYALEWWDTQNEKGFPCFNAADEDYAKLHEAASLFMHALIHRGIYDELELKGIK